MLLISFVVILQCIDTELSIGISILSPTFPLLYYQIVSQFRVQCTDSIWPFIIFAELILFLLYLSVMECSEIGFSATFNLIDAFKLSSHIHILMCVYSLLVIRLQ